jgi:hypothetical protein
VSDATYPNSIEARVEKTFAAFLKTQVPGLAWHEMHLKPSGVPPYGAVQADEAREAGEKSGVFYVPTVILVTHALDEGAGVGHTAVVQRVKLALDVMPTPAEDEETGLRLYGFTVLKQVLADVAHEQGTLFELQVGCGRMEGQPAGGGNDEI